MLIASFEPSTGWAGRTITFYDGRFTLEGHGLIDAPAVLEYDRRGYLAWAYDGLREWVQSLAPAPAAPPAPAGLVVTSTPPPARAAAPAYSAAPVAAPVLAAAAPPYAAAPVAAPVLAAAAPPYAAAPVQADGAVQTSAPAREVPPAPEPATAPTRAGRRRPTADSRDGRTRARPARR